jgi:hypothetical protein
MHKPRCQEHNGGFWFDRLCDDQLQLPQSHSFDKRANATARFCTAGTSSAST